MDFYRENYLFARVAIYNGFEFFFTFPKFVISIVSLLNLFIKSVPNDPWAVI